MFLALILRMRPYEPEIFGAEVSLYTTQFEKKFRKYIIAIICSIRSYNHTAEFSVRMIRGFRVVATRN